MLNPNLDGKSNFAPCLLIFPYWLRNGKSCNRDIAAIFGIPNLSWFTDHGQKLDGEIHDFWISSQSHTKRNCQNSRTSNDIDMKLAPVTKIYKRITFQKL